MASEILPTQESTEFYLSGAKYWSQVPPTVNGMLGGFASISKTDIQSSKALLKQLFSSKQPPGRSYVLDCGAGIGRITKFLLSNLFDRVDMVEQNPVFLETAKGYLGSTLMETKIGNMFPVGLQAFQPEPCKYDVIWVQWVLGHLTDGDLIQFLISCQAGLKPNGVIVVKENVTSSELVEVDQTDSSVTRPIGLLKTLFLKAGLCCTRAVKQLNFPKGLYTVYMFILKPEAIIKCENKDLTVIKNAQVSENGVVNTNNCEISLVDSNAAAIQYFTTETENQN